MTIVNLKINDREITAEQGKTILQAALENGIEIPHLCHDERVKPYGACGLCVVEVEGSPKLLRACATNISEGMVIKTDTQRTTSTRKSALKLLLSDHRGDCRPPCVLECPAHTDCQGYVGLIANGQYKEAVALIKEQLPIPASIGRVCPHPCESACRRTMVEEPVAIAALKAFVGDLDLQGESYMADIKALTGKKAAVVGAGPAGLTCAYFLAREGHSVTVYEAMPNPGGMLRYGIPEYRLPKAVLDQEVELIQRMGVEIIYNTKLGRDISIDELKQKYDAVCLAVGAWESSALGCAGQDMAGVLGGIDFLREAAFNKSMKIGNRVLVVGGGNTAMDVARTAVRLGAEKVSVIYRRTREEMPAEDIEVVEAGEEGVEFNFLYAPIEVVGNGSKAVGLKCQRMRLGEPDASGRRKPEPVPGEVVLFEADVVISAIGQKVTMEGINSVKLTKYGTIEIDERTYETNIPGVFAGGDAVTGPKIAIEAVGYGKRCAIAMDGYMNNKQMPQTEPMLVKQTDLTPEDFADRPKLARACHHAVDPEVRKHNFDEVAHTMTEEAARKEAARCLECGCRDYFECALLKYTQAYEIDPQKTSGEKHKRKESDEHPFIERNSDKCILCGLCVRACDEAVGATALGLVDRGFDSIVKPEFCQPLKESSCISCGMCAAVCPTGACMEKEAVEKQVPLAFESTVSICSYCGVGCKMVLQSNGNKVYRALPYENGFLCAKGRFGIWHMNDEERLLRPLLKKASRHEEAAWDEALTFAAGKLKAAAEKYGKDSIAVVLSPGLTNEEAYLAKEIAKSLNTAVIGPVTEISAAMEASTASCEDLQAADLILAAGNIAENHKVMDISINQAASKGTRRLDVRSGEISAAGLPDSLVKAIEAARKPIIVIDEDTVSDDAVTVLSKLSKTANNRTGIIITRSKNNSQGLLDLGITQSGRELTGKITDGTIKALVVLGEDVAQAGRNMKAALKKLDFLMTADLYMTETAGLSDLVLPLVSFAESGGSFTRCDGMVQSAAPAIKPRTGKTGMEVLLELGNKLEVGIRDINAVREGIMKDVSGYVEKAAKAGRDEAAASFEPPFRKRAVYCTIDNRFEKYARENGIKI